MPTPIFVCNCLRLLITLAIVGVGILPEGAVGLRCYTCTNTSDCARAIRNVKTTGICRFKNREDKVGHNYCYSIVKDTGWVKRGCSTRADAICMIAHQSGPGGCIKYTQANRAKLKKEYTSCVVNASALGSAATVDEEGGGAHVSGDVVVDGWCACNKDYCNKHTMVSITATPKPRITTTTEAAPEAMAGASKVLFGIVSVMIPTVVMFYV